MQEQVVAPYFSSCVSAEYLPEKPCVQSIICITSEGLYFLNKVILASLQSTEDIPRPGPTLQSGPYCLQVLGHYQTPTGTVE